MPVVFVPAPYRGPTRGESEILVAGSTVRECLEAVEAKHRGFIALVTDTDGGVHRFVTLFRNGEKLGREALETSVEPNDRIEVLAAIAGG